MIQVDPPDYPPWPTARRLTPLWWGQRTLVLLALFCAFIYVGLSLGIPILIQRAIDNAIVPGNPSDVWPYVIAIMVLAVIRFWINFTRRYATARIGVRIEAQLREMLFAGYLRFPRAFFDRHPTGQVVSRATNDLFPIRYFIGWGVVQGVQSAMMIVGGAIVLASINPRLTLYTGVATPLIAFVAWRFAHLVMPISRQVQARKGDVTEAADEAVVGIEMVQAFGREDDVRRRFGGKAQAVRDTVINQAGVESQHLPALFFLPTISIAAVVFFGGRDVINGDLTIGQFVLFNTILLQLAWPLEALGWILNLAQRAIASAGRSFAWLEEVSYLPEPDSRPSCPRAPSAAVPERPLRLHGRGAGAAGHRPRRARRPDPRRLRPDGLGQEHAAEPGPRLYDPTEGRLLLGGVDVRDLRLATLRNAVAVITQRPVLFSITLRENVTAGRPDAPWDEVRRCAAAAGVSEFADELPDGYETLIGERGVNLSGGQRQRVALARALVAGTRVIVMDDPLSAVDTHTEEELVDGLRPVLEGRTVLLATQRLSTLELADRAVVLRDGKIVEDGLPGELLVGDGDFAALFGEELIGV